MSIINNTKFKIAAFIMCYNEKEILPHLIRHYKEFCTDIYIINNCSTDETPIIAENLGCNVINMPPEFNELDEIKYLYIKQNCYKNFRHLYDYIVVADADEFLYHKNIFSYLEQNSHINVFKCKGYDMWYDNFDYEKGDYKEIKRGRLSVGYNKCAIFKSNIDILYSPGCHECYVQNHESEFELRHLKHINVDYLAARYAVLAARRSQRNKQAGWGFHVETTREKVEEWSNKLRDESTVLEW
jgi:glycosyltransferase involved in cell wall biosynthesis